MFGLSLPLRLCLLFLSQALPDGACFRFLVEQICDIIREFHASGTTILLVEQNAGKALAIADRAYVLEQGRITLSGTGADLAASDAVKKAYLGG